MSQPPKDENVPEVVTVDRLSMTLDEGTHQHTNQDKDEESPLKAALRHKRILLHSIAAFFAGMVFGYDTLVNATSISMPAFLMYFGEQDSKGSFYLPSIWTSLWVAMSALTQAIGGVAIGPVSDRVGRRWGCIGACLVSVAGVAMQYCATSRGLLLGGKMVNGLAIGSLTATSTAWASEISPVRLRGPIQSGIVLFTVVMQGVALVVVKVYASDLTEHSFRVVFAIQWAWSLITAILFFVMPESPTWLILHNEVDAAKASLSRLYGGKADVDARFTILRDDVERERRDSAEKGAGTYMDAFKGTDLKRTLTVMWLFLSTGMVGGTILSQSIYLLVIAGMNFSNIYDVSIGGFGLAALAIIASWYLLERFGRRLIWLVGSGVNILAMAVIGGLYYVPGIGKFWAIAAVMNVLLSWQIVTITSVAWVVTAEISSYRLRAKTQSIAVSSLSFTTWFFTFITPYLYNVDAANLGVRAAFIFMGTSVVVLIGSYFLVPDLQGFTTKEVDWLYENNIPVTEFQKYANGRLEELVDNGKRTSVSQS